MTQFRRGHRPAANLYEELVVDCFAGGGGASTGIEAALGRCVDVAVNHDPEAVALHTVNHPNTTHFCEDIFEVDPVKATGGRPVGLAWFSPDCKHFSKAKGGKPVSPRVRGLAWVVIKWARAVRPRVIMLENVEEFTTWGPLDANQRPCPARKGRTFRRWKRSLEQLGYAVEHRELRACDYGAPTIRKRLFVIARCDDQPIVWPAQTHAEGGKGGLQPWRTAADCIDWTIPCPSIFERPRPLAEATLRRIARGIHRFVLTAAEPFIVPVTHSKAEGRGHGVGQPMRTVTTAKRGEMALVAPTLVSTANTKTTGRGPNTWPATSPVRTVTTREAHAVVAPTLVEVGYGEAPGQKPRAPGIGKPLGTVVASAQKHALVAAFMAQHNTGMTGHRAGKPLSTITSRGTQQGVVTAHLMTNTTGHAPSAAEAPVPTVTTGQQQAVVAASMVKLRGTCKDGQSVEKPAPTVTAGGNHAGLVYAFMTAYFGNEKDGQAVDGPARTITTKERFGLVTITIKRKVWAIADIGMRMLTPRELYRAQGFPDSYIIDRTAAGPLSKTAQVRMCGNSVCPPLAEAIVRANFGLAQRRKGAA